MKIARGYAATKAGRSELAAAAGIPVRDVRSADVDPIADLRFRAGEGVAVMGLEVFATHCRRAVDAVKAIAEAVKHVQSFGADVVEVPAMEYAGKGAAMVHRAIARRWKADHGMTPERSREIGKKGGRPATRPEGFNEKESMMIWGDLSIDAETAAAQIGIPRSSCYPLFGTRKSAAQKIKEAFLASRPKRAPAKKSKTKSKR